MNFVLIITAVGLALLVANRLDGWVQAHALAELVGDKWAIQAQGWPALWPQLAVGLLAGAAAAFVLGLVISGSLAKALQERRNRTNEDGEKLLAEQREGLAKRRASIDAEIQKVVRVATTAANQQVENLSLENEKKREIILRLERKIEIIEKRLAGSKRARLARQKKAQLTSV